MPVHTLAKSCPKCWTRIEHKIRKPSDAKSSVPCPKCGAEVKLNPEMVASAVQNLESKSVPVAGAIKTRSRELSRKTKAISKKPSRDWSSLLEPKRVARKKPAPY